MKLNHLDLQVPDVQRAAAFFERFLGFQHQSNRNSPAIAILSGEDGFVLVLQRKEDDAESYPEGFHIGCLVEDEQTVFDVQTRWKEAGLAASEVDRNGRGLVAFCRTPDGILVEVSCRKRA